MKNKILIILLIVLLIIVLFVNFNKKNNEESKKDEEMYSTKKEDIIYGEKMSIIKKDNGWYLYMIQTTNGDVSASMCNIKLPSPTVDEGYYIDMIDEEGNVISKSSVAMRELFYYHDLKSKKDAKNEIILLQNFFKNNENINIDEIKKLNLYFFDENDLFKAYSELNEKDYKTHSKDLYLQLCDIKQDKMNNGYQYNIGFIASYGGIEMVNMDVLFQNGQYLSDLVGNNLASASQKEFYNNLLKIGEYVVNNNTYEIEGKFDFEGEEYERLYKLFNSFIEFQNSMSNKNN